MKKSQVSLMKLMKPRRDSDFAVKRFPKERVRLNDDEDHLHFRLQIHSASSDRTYLVDLAFPARPAQKGGVRVDGSCFRVPTLKSKCKVSCQCEDFKYTFAGPNLKVDALAQFGWKFDPSEIKPSKTGKKRNPKDVPGACQHIVAAARYLLKHGHIEKEKVV